MASGLSIVIDTRNAELNIKNLNQALERLENQGNSIANMMRNLGGNNPFAALTASINVTKSDFNALAASANMVKTTTKEMGDALVYAKTTLTGAATAATTFQAAMRGVGNSLNTAQAAMARFNQSGQSIANVLNTMNGASGSNGVNNLNNAIKQLNPSVTALNAEFKAVNATLNSFTTAANKADAAALRLNTTLTATRTNLSGLATANAAVNASIGNLGNVLNNLQTRLAGLGTTLNGLNANLRNLPPLNNAAASSANRAAASTSLFQRNAQGLEATLMRLQTLMTGGLFGMAALSIAKTADAMQGLENQVRLVTQGEEQREEVQRRLLVIANKNYADIEATTGSYQRNAFALAQLGKSQMDVLNFTDALSLAMRTGGRSMVEQKSAVYQLSQAMGAGKLMGDEFRALSENAPIILKYIAKEMGVAQGALKELGSEGKITSEIIYNAMMKARPEMEKMAQSLPITMSQAWQQVNNSYKTFIDNFMNGTGGMSQGIASMLQGIGKNFDALANIAIAGAGVAMLGFANKVLFAGGAFAKLTTIMKANPLFLIASVVIGASIATRGFDETIQDLGNTLGVLGSVLGDVIGFFGDLANTAYTAFSGILTNANETADGSNQAFGGFFADTGTGFQGFLVGTVKVFDAIAVTVRSTAQYCGERFGKMVIDVSNFFITLSNNVKTAFAGVVNYVVDSINQSIGAINGLIEQANSKTIFGYGLNIGTMGMVGRYTPNLGQTKPSLPVSYQDIYDANAKSQQTSGLQAVIQAKYDNVKATKASADATAKLTETMSPYEAAMYRQQQAINAVTEAQKNRTKAENDAAKLAKNSGNDLVSNTTLKSLRIKSSEATSGGLVTRANSEFAKITQSALGSDLKYFSAFNDRYHLGKNSQHNKGNAFDVVLKNASDARKAAVEIQAAAKQYGYSIKILNEYANPSKNATGGHLHVSVLGRGNIGAGAFDIKQFDQMAKSGESAAAKALKTQEDLKQKRLQIREQYALGVQKIEAGLARKITEIKEAGFSDKEQTRLIALAQNQADIEKKIYLNGLTDKLNGLLDFKQTEIDKIRDAAQKERDAITTNAELQLAENADVKQKMLDAIDERAQYELAQYQLTQDSKMSELLAFNKTELQLIKEKYDIEAKRIALSNESLAVKAAQNSANENKLWTDTGTATKSIGDKYFSQMSTMYGQDNPFERVNQYQEQNKIIQDMRDADLISHEQYLSDLSALDADYANKKTVLLMNKDAALYGGLLDLMKGFVGENSKTYRIMFAIQKGWALATSIIDNQVALGKAWSSAPFPYNLPAILSTASQTGVITAAIAAVSPKGFSTGGYTGNMGVNDIAGVVHGKEYVVNARNTVKYRDTLEQMNRGTYKEGGNVQVNNYAGVGVTARQENGLTIIDVRNEIERKMRADMRNPSSDVGKAIYGNSTARPRRD